MNKQWDELRERLLRAGVAPRHVRRYLAELRDHLADLRAEEQHPGRSPAEAQAAAFSRLGSIDDLTRAMATQPNLRSWSARAPWAVFGIAPLAALALAWCVALFLLWSGWRMFLPDATTPFVGIHRGAIVYFGFGRLLFFGAPLFVGWALILITIRQRLSVAGALFATLVVGLAGATARVHALSIGAQKHVGLSFVLGRMLPTGPFTSDPLAWWFSGVATYLLALLTLTLLPYAAWRLRQSSTAATRL